MCLDQQFLRINNYVICVCFYEILGSFCHALSVFRSTVLKD
jgi:hypothetical protein